MFSKKGIQGWLSFNKQQVALFIQLLFASVSLGQGISLDWPRHLSGGGKNQPLDMHVTTNQEVYIAGRYTGIIDLDPGPGVYSLTTGTDPYVWEPYITKLDSSGNFIWGAAFLCITTPSLFSACNSVVTDNSGNVYVGGSFTEILDFDPGSSTYTMDPSNGSAYLCKLSAGGQFVWARQFGDTLGLNFSCHLTIDNQNNVVIAGTFEGQADFDPGTSQFLLNAAGLSDNYVCKLNSSGVFIWAVSVGGLGYEGSSMVATNPASEIIFSNQFENTVDFDPGAGVYTLSASSGSFVVVKLSANGGFIFAKQFQAQKFDDIEVDVIGNIYVSGGINTLSNLSTGPGTFTVTLVGDYDGFISKLDNSGNFIWGQTFGGPAHDRAISISIDSGRNVYLAGIFQQVADFGPGQMTYTLATQGLTDACVVKFDSTGSLKWARALGGPSVDDASEIVSAPHERIYVSGKFYQTCDFDPNSGTSFLNTAPNQYETFIAKYGPCPVSICGGVGIDEFEKAKISVYPNPSSDRIYIELDKNRKIGLFDVLGKQLGEYNLPGGNNSISVDHLSAGLYFLQFENKNERIKFVRE